MTLRLRLTLVAAAVVAIVVAAASLTIYFLVRHDLRMQIDDSLRTHAAAAVQRPDTALHGQGFGQFSGDYVALVGVGGGLVPTSVAIPVDARIKAIARNNTTPAYFIRDTQFKGFHLREIVAPVPDFGAVVIVRSLADVDHELGKLRLILILVSLGGVAVAAIAGALVSRTTLAPVRRLTHTAERIAETGDPSERVPGAGGANDELGRLGTAFNTMLGALEESLEVQRRFVADASHELRTPLTSLQTNIEVLKQAERLDDTERSKLFADLEREAHEMRDLIAGLIELARGDANVERTTVHVDEIVESAVDRARARFPNVHVNAHVEPTTIEGIPERIERAVWNLIENAGKWTTPGSSVEVTLSGGELRVRDHGPGIAADDRERIFDRFYRSAGARSLPGSGLGLAIVRDVAQAHGGSVSAEDAPGGGALMRLRLAGP
jgi:two-component system sensor histidine kinase MprB